MNKENSTDSTRDKENSLQEYLDSLSEKEKKAYEIARSHLGSSFHLAKSIGYLTWVKNKKM